MIKSWWPDGHNSRGEKPRKNSVEYWVFKKKKKSAPSALCHEYAAGWTVGASPTCYMIALKVWGSDNRKWEQFFIRNVHMLSKDAPELLCSACCRCSNKAGMPSGPSLWLSWVQVKPGHSKGMSWGVPPDYNSNDSSPKAQTIFSGFCLQLHRWNHHPTSVHVNVTGGTQISAARNYFLGMSRRRSWP